MIHEPLAVTCQGILCVGVAEHGGHVLATKQRLAVVGDGADDSEGIVGKGLDGVAHNKTPVLRAK
ncbi:hypothetical protein CJ184_006290 [Actinotignum urinale]|uniref:Uncharacterized protein n=1 Tax=Actinotignum urinale TaxID=190146 RepID=A0AAW9HRV2_9ACTO|nr:hypothetical protein [Actinotignum urinale]MDY5129576.1 hypothetical protein [Actinotignum urinale]MDY5133387.1 hypothetical protein [Actinotignum urinale]MDY5155357.1 hypothetical protein [Actinotignum urinale]WIK59862.1 hypothetical protein CJ184_006290 [Actinotignum urinale]